jgi:hypothetical protein
MRFVCQYGLALPQFWMVDGNILIKQSRAADMCRHSVMSPGNFTHIKQIIIVRSVIQHAKRMLLIVICGLPRSTLFFHIHLNGKIFEKKY